MRRVVGLTIAAIGLGFICTAGWLWYAIYADRSQPRQAAQVIVPQGSTFRDVAQELAAADVIAHPTLFRLYAKLRGAETGVHAGAFAFGPHQTAAEVLAQLQNGGAQVARWVTIPEGFTAAQIAQRFSDQGFGSAKDYQSAFMRDTIVLGGVRTRNLEGYLFPSTYLVPIGSTPRAVERILTDQFMKVLPADAAMRARARRLTIPAIVTLASLIEREAKADDERPLMAGVYYNRLRLRMPLQVDASIEYALPRHHDVITEEDLKIDSPYNTYLHDGLPPTPIANPGLPSLRAALDPKSSQFLYYVYKGNGHHAFARTLAQQNVNIAKYLR